VQAGDVLAQLDGLVHRGMGRHALGEEQLIGADPQRRSQGRLELGRRAGGQRLHRVVERPHPLDGAEREAHRLAAVALVEAGPLRLGPEGAVGVGVLLERPADDFACHRARAHVARSGARRSPRR
jgi:hypothetical protein